MIECLETYYKYLTKKQLYKKTILVSYSLEADESKDSSPTNLTLEKSLADVRMEGTFKF